MTVQQGAFWELRKDVEGTAQSRVQEVVVVAPCDEPLGSWHEQRSEHDVSHPRRRLGHASRPHVGLQLGVAQDVLKLSRIDLALVTRSLAVDHQLDEVLNGGQLGDAALLLLPLTPVLKTALSHSSSPPSVAATVAGDGRTALVMR